jgi:nitrite reductase (NADH) small subunit
MGARRLAICNDAGAFYACEDVCPHEGSTLARGRVCEGQIVCPVHHWPWDLKSGLTDPSLPHLRLRLYACEVRDGKVYVDVSEPLPPELTSFQI